MVVKQCMSYLIFYFHAKTFVKSGPKRKTRFGGGSIRWVVTLIASMRIALTSTCTGEVGSAGIFSWHVYVKKDVGTRESYRLFLATGKNIKISHMALQTINERQRTNKMSNTRHDVEHHEGKMYRNISLTGRQKYI